MPKVNPLDQMIDILVQEFQKVENFELMSQGEHGNKMLHLSVVRQGEIKAFKQMFVSYFIPKASELFVQSKNYLAKSKYKNIITITDDQLKENVYETIRLGYVGMFHKYEAYVIDLIECAELVISEKNNKETSLQDFVYKKFSHQISKEKGKYDKPIIQKLNWISNSIKHCDGRPYPKYKPVEFENLTDNERLKFSKDDFIKDIDLLIEHYLLKMRLVFNLALYKSFFEVEHETEYPEKLNEQRGKLDKLLTDLLKPN